MTEIEATQGMRWRFWLDVLVSIVLLAAGLAVLSATLLNRDGNSRTARQAPPVPSEVLDISQDAVKGDPVAPAVLIVYSDFQCPFCARFAREIMPELERRFVSPGRIAIAFRHLPLPVHPEAFTAASVAACAPGGFWQAHDALFARQMSLPGTDLSGIVGLAGLKGDAIKSCAQTQGAEHVRADIASADRLKIDSTPTILAGVRVPGGVQVKTVISGAKPLAEFTGVIDSILSRR